MKIKELITKLEKYNPEAIVIVQKDSEGNGYSPLYAADDGHYQATSTYSGKPVLVELTPELRQLGFSEDDLARGDGEVSEAVFLIPTN